MDYTLERSKLLSLHSRLSVVKQGVQTVKANKEKYLDAEKTYQKLESVLKEIDYYVARLGFMLSKYKAQESNYKNSRLKFVETAINSRLSKMFPYDNYQIRIKFTEDRKDRVMFQLVDKIGIPRSMTISAGGMMQSTILYSVFVTIAEVLGSGILWFDEGFAASDDNNLDKVSEEINEAVENGMQVWMVEHRNRGYKNVKKRQEIILHKDFNTGKVGTIEHKKYY